jgi:two-component sensor histidine kinase
MHALRRTLISKCASFLEPKPEYAWVFAGFALIVVWYVGDSGKVWFTWLSRLLIVYALALSVSNHLSRGLGLLGKVVAAIFSASAASYLTELGISLFFSPPYPAQFGGGKDLLIAIAFSSLFLISNIIREESERQVKTERQLVELRLNALQAQIEPHFLYNTLANVQELVRTSASDAEKMLQHLITYLKAAIPEVRSGTGRLGQEMERAHSYLQIMQIRMGTRLRFEIDVAEELRSIPVPPLGVLTLVENAVKHGIDRLPQGGMVTVRAIREGNDLTLKVYDTGIGFGDNLGSGMGLNNLRERLDTLYAKQATLELTHRQPHGVEATLRIPIKSTPSIPIR